MIAGVYLIFTGCFLSFRVVKCFSSAQNRPFHVRRADRGRSHSGAVRDPAGRPAAQPHLAQGRPPYFLRARNPHQPGRVLQHPNYPSCRSPAQRQLHLRGQQSGQGGQTVLHPRRQRSVCFSRCTCAGPDAEH